MKTTKPHIILVVLKLNLPVHDLLALAKAIISAMTGNSYFPTPNPPLATINSDVTSLDAAETVALTKVKGAAAARNAKLVILVNDLKTLKAYVQTVANADADNADAIILSAGMSIRKSTTRNKQDIAVKSGVVSGSVHVVAKAAASRASYNWQYSTNLKTWTNLPTTLQARTTVSNLAPGTTVYFRSSAVTKAGAADWTEPTSIIVK